MIGKVEVPQKAFINVLSLTIKPLNIISNA
jgi:hypothetical protein